jgi:hypothetical protein
MSTRRRCIVLVIPVTASLMLVMIWIMPSPPQNIGEGFLIQFSNPEFASAFFTRVVGTYRRNLALRKLNRVLATLPLKGSRSRMDRPPLLQKACTGLYAPRVLQGILYSECDTLSTVGHIYPNTYGHWQSGQFSKIIGTKDAAEADSLPSSTLMSQFLEVFWLNIGLLNSIIASLKS